MSDGLIELLSKIERHLARQSVKAPPNIVAPYVEYTLNAADTITLTGYDKFRFISVDTAGDVASDEMHYINGGSQGDVLFIIAANSARTVVVKDDEATGNLALAGDFSLDNTRDTITLIYSGTYWFELSRSDNAA